MVLPNLALFVGRTNPPSTFLQPGKFSAEFSGNVTVELRAQYTFRAVAKGGLELLVNGNSVLNLSETGDSSEPSKPVRLNRGTNSILVRFVAPDRGDAQFQLLWTPKNSAVAIPIPTEVLSYDEMPELKQSAQLRRGLHLFAEYRCGRCHASEGAISPELDFGAPDFENIGSRLNSGWMAEWIANPTGRMPKLFRDAESARKVAAYLASLKGAAQASSSQGDFAMGEELFRTLNCSACHAESSNIRPKFLEGALAPYLENPQAHYPWNAMPNFKLSHEEAADLSAFLNRSATAVKDFNWSEAVADGQALLQKSGCLSCHSAKLENKYSAPPLAAIGNSGRSGCLSTNGPSRAPQFNLKPEEQEALAAFLRNGNLAALHHPAPHELALRQVQTLRCAECHEEVDGVPRISVLGGKLKPKWVRRFIRGEVHYKPRPWMPQRMPAFPAHASTLANGLAALHGNSPETHQTTAVDTQQADIGAKLISSAGGFSCVACHAVGSFTSGQVVETPGVNLAHSGERLLECYFQRWVLNPVALEPNTKMPVYFDAQGRSQLTEILEGDGEKQIKAIWEYVRLGDKMPPPPTPQP